MPALAGAADLDVEAQLSRAYLHVVEAMQDRLVTAMSAALDTSVEPSFRYRAALNGVAVELTPEETVSPNASDEAAEATGTNSVDATPNSMYGTNSCGRGDGATAGRQR